MTKVVVKHGNVDGALRMLKQKNAKSGLLKEAREKEHYSKPGVKKRMAKLEAIKASRKASKKERRDY
jgi:small subunit ribosomal protein S21